VDQRVQTMSDGGRRGSEGEKINTPPEIQKYGPMLFTRYL